MVLDWQELRGEFIGLHLKSEFVNQGERTSNTGGEEQERFIREALSARTKMTTNVRTYIHATFRQTAKPKEYFEERDLFFDRVSSLPGDVFFASRFLNRALFDYPHELRWSVQLNDLVDPRHDSHILLDHILFTQPLVDSAAPWRVDANAQVGSSTRCMTLSTQRSQTASRPAVSGR